MSASNSTRTELRTLREVAHFLLPLVCCEFCGKPLLDPKLSDKVFGNKTHSPLKKLKLTVHHRNGKHGDNHREGAIDRFGSNISQLAKVQRAICGNTSLVHRLCHSEYEMKANHHKRKVMKVKPMGERARELVTKIKLAPLSKPEIDFVVKMLYRLGTEKKVLTNEVTRYEIRRLKKLAAKVEGRSVKTKSKIR
jgi:hypothetical protein